MNVLIHITGNNPERDFLSMAWEGIEPLYAIELQDFTSQLYRDPDQIGLLHCHMPFTAPAIVREIRQAEVMNRLMVTLPERGGPACAARERAQTLMAGADDVQPSRIAEVELVARLRALAGRGEYRDHLHVEMPGCVYDHDRGGFVTAAGRIVRLSPTLGKMMDAFARHPGWTISKQRLMDAVYGGLDEPRLQTLEIFVSMLRRKMRQATGGLECIHTDWGRGYRFEPNEPFKPEIRRRTPGRWK